MTGELFPTTERIHMIVAEEIGDAGGTVSDCYDDGRRLFLRAVLPAVREVRVMDGVQGGVAVAAIGEDIRVHPYTFRQVCRNGAVMSRVIGTESIRRAAWPRTEAEWELRQILRTCASAEVFAGAVSQMRSAADQRVDESLMLLPLLLRFSRHLAQQVVSQFTRGRDPSGFGLMNAITSVARDEPDPETRWRLEELGGGVPALVPPVPRCGAAAAELVLT